MVDIPKGTPYLGMHVYQYCLPPFYSEFKGWMRGTWVGCLLGVHNTLGPLKEDNSSLDMMRVGGCHTSGDRLLSVVLVAGGHVGGICICP